MPNTKCANLTGRKINGWEFGEEVAPEYAGVPAGHDNIVVLPDGRHAYAIQESMGTIGTLLPIYLEATAMDAGDNVCERRLAPASLQGITVPSRGGGSGQYTLIGDKLVGWLKR